MYLWPSGTVPKYTSIPQWHCAKVYLYTPVALCQSIPLYPSGTVPLPAPTCMHLLPLAVHIWMRAFEYLSLAACIWISRYIESLCQSISLYPSGTVPLPAPTCMHLLPLAVHIWMRAFEYLSLAARIWIHHIDCTHSDARHWLYVNGRARYWLRVIS